METKTMTLKGGGGTRLSVVRTGNPQGQAILFLHGFCQSHLAFHHQLQDQALHQHDLWALDLRGHGASDKPIPDEAYQGPELWAADVEAVMDAIGDKTVVIVAWSYAGYLVGDYIAHHGTRRVAGLNLVGAAMKKDASVAHTVGPAFKSHVADLCSGDLLIAMKGVRKLVAECAYLPVDAALSDMAHLVACMTPHYVRLAMLKRTVVQDAVLKTVQCPVLVTHGRKDSVILPDMVEVTTSLLPGATVSWYDCGHSPFQEQATRFNAELDAFARACQAAT